MCANRITSTTMKIRWWSCWQRLMMVVIVVVISMLDMTTSDPQINLLFKACSPTIAPSFSNLSNLDAVFLDIGSQLSNENTHFATEYNFIDNFPIYIMVQCRNYLSTAECVACFDAAVSEIRSCSPAIGAHITYVGCFLRYEIYKFDNQTVQDYNDFSGKCDNKNVSQARGFDAAVKGLLADLQVETPKINGFFVATKREVSGGSATVYAVAQCVETLSVSGCQECLTVAYKTIKTCTPASNGMAFEVGCFLRYSKIPFFADNQTTATPVLGGGPTGDRTNHTTGEYWINHRIKIILGISAGVFGLVLVSVLMIICYLKRNNLSGNTMVFWRKKTIKDRNVEALIRNDGSLAPKHYNHSDIKRITNSFADKLGQGGYGAVYKGQLFDGRLVAVKVLSETKGNGEEFINEVASISRTSHVNVVTLLGFCYESNKRALVYEFMSNGSLDRFIYRDGSLNSFCHLGCKTLYQIAVGVARGLEYLHRGCSTRIVHFDIKPQNILLDDDFCPKIADFGLAKLGQRKESIMSMVGTRGTVGYIAPEVFSRKFGGVSHKSDVYSYGMMVLEMVGGRNDIEGRIVHSSEKYFPDLIYDHLEHGADLIPQGVATEEEKETRKMTIVSLWCIQTNPADRPSMTNVVEMLEGSLQSLQIPPKPILRSPPRLAQDPYSLLPQSSSTE